MTFDEFLATLDQALQDLPLKVLYHPTRIQSAEPDQILIGVGRWTLDRHPIEHRGVCLNNKGLDPCFPGFHYPSVTDLALAPPDALTQQWDAAVAGATDPDALLRRFTLVVEDVGPDSCFALLCWLARRGGVDLGESPASPVRPWANAVRHWETTGMAEDPFTAWTVLLSTLGHSYIPPTATASEPTTGAVDLGRAWSEALSFTVALLRRRVDPNAVPPLWELSGYARARACLNAEYRDYRESLDHAVRLQLLVPLSDTDDARQLLVDAYFAVETWPSGAKKLFVRTDREHTYLGQGFALMGLYRPNERIKGSGNDMTVSVDPLSGIYLKALWEELERLENARWEGRRPRENPRVLASYQGRQGYTEPWWDDSGRYTLLGAPRRLPDDPEQRLGSRLCWTDVVEAAWRCYNPLRDLWVQDALDPDRPRRLEQCRCERWRFDGGSFAFGKRLAAVRWLNDTAQPQSLVLSPTAQRCFAALVAREPADGSIRIADLPAESEFDFLSLSGGFAVIHEQGVFLFDDWRTEPLRIEELRVEFTRICNLLGQIRWVAGQLDELMRPLSDAARSSPARPLVGMLADLTTLSTLRGRLARAKHQYGPKSAHEDVRRFRQRLESGWGIGAAVDALYQRVSEIEDAFRTAGALRTQGLVGIIATYGLPFFISGTITGFLAEWIEAWAMRIAWEPWTPLLKVGVYAAITGLLIAGIMALQRRVLDRSNQDRPDPPGAAEGSGRPTGFPSSKKSQEK